MKRKNYISKNNFKFSNNFLRENNMKILDKFTGNVDTSDKRNIMLFGDHQQRMLMDGLKNMLEAMIEGQYGIAERYSRLDDELGELYKKYVSSFELKALYIERSQNPGYTIDPELEEDIQKIITLFR